MIELYYLKCCFLTDIKHRSSDSLQKFPGFVGQQILVIENEKRN